MFLFFDLDHSFFQSPNKKYNKNFLILLIKIFFYAPSISILSATNAINSPLVGFSLLL